MNFETLGDWCKWLEKNFSPDVMIPKLPVIIRLDGNNFHNYTLGLKRPFDEGLTDLMIQTTKFLVDETNAKIGYTQSDEITLVLYSPDRDSLIYHDGKKQKILSKLTGKCVLFFNGLRETILPNHRKIANFDCRIYQTPTLADACNQLLWRELDATKNSISMLGQSVLSHKDLFKKNSSQIQDTLMLEKGINWNDLPTKFKRGTYIRRISQTKPFTEVELENLPPKHLARTNPELVVTRKVTSIAELPPMSKITNKIGVVFEDEEPITNNELSTSR